MYAMSVHEVLSKKREITDYLKYLKFPHLIRFSRFYTMNIVYNLYVLRSFYNFFIYYNSCLSVRIRSLNMNIMLMLKH